MKIGITGPNGRLGSYLVQIGCEPIYKDLADLVAQDLDRFDVIINCAAKTSVDACQAVPGASVLVVGDYYQQAVVTNVRSLDNLRRSYSGRLIHISTDYVFKGDRGPYKEEDERDPVNDYGFTKFGGEIVLESMPECGQTVIVRTTGLFGNGRDFAASVLRKLGAGVSILASVDLHGNHTYIPHLCEALMQLAMTSLPHPVTYLHIASRDVMPRFTFAYNLALEFGLDFQKIHQCTSDEIGAWIAPRPTFGGLVVTRAENLGLPIYDTKDGIREYKKVYQ